jgi:hypothetical protein
MKKSLILIYCFILSIAFATGQSATESRPLKPSGFQSKTSINISGKSRNYYWLSSTEPSVITVQGPGTLKVHSRGQFMPGGKDAMAYTILYTIDGGEQESKDISGIERSQKAAYSDGTPGIPGELNTIEIELRRGYHNIELKLGDNSQNAAARFIFTPSKIKKQEWIAFSPVLPSEPVDLISKETTTAYYRFSMNKPLKVEIIGPTELRVLTRTENHFQMKGRINYRIQVKEDGIVLNTYQLNSKLSEVAVYKDDKELIPGTACEFVIYVPKGNHSYEILPLDPDKNTLLGRLLIPKKDVILEGR